MGVIGGLGCRVLDLGFGVLGLGRMWVSRGLSTVKIALLQEFCRGARG